MHKDVRQAGQLVDQCFGDSDENAKNGRTVSLQQVVRLYGESACSEGGLGVAAEADYTQIAEFLEKRAGSGLELFDIGADDSLRGSSAGRDAGCAAGGGEAGAPGGGKVQMDA